MKVARLTRQPKSPLETEILSIIPKGFIDIYSSSADYALLANGEESNLRQETKIIISFDNEEDGVFLEIHYNDLPVCTIDAYIESDIDMKNFKDSFEEILPTVYDLFMNKRQVDYIIEYDKLEVSDWYR